MHISTKILMAINLIVWGYFVWSGLDGMRSIEAQHAPGYPNSGQFDYYVVFPVIMVALTLAVPILLNRTRWYLAGQVSLIITLVLLLPFLFAYTGGM